jgi:hypothetical protein
MGYTFPGYSREAAGQRLSFVCPASITMNAIIDLRPPVLQLDGNHMESHASMSRGEHLYLLSKQLLTQK